MTEFELTILISIAFAGGMLVGYFIGKQDK